MHVSALTAQLLLNASLHHPVLAGAVAGAGQVTLEYERRLDLVKLLQQPLVLENRVITKAHIR